MKKRLMVAGIVVLVVVAAIVYVARHIHVEVVRLDYA